MRAFIKTINCTNNDCKISFLTNVGLASGFLTNFDKVKPTINQTIDIELDIDLLFEQLNFSLAGFDFCIIAFGKTLELQGKIEDIESDMVYFRLAQDCLIMIATEQDFSHLNQHFVKLTVPIESLNITIFGI